LHFLEDDFPTYSPNSNNMKTTSLILLSLMISLTGYCQDINDYSAKRNELNLGSFNAFELNSIGDFGVGYKRFGEKGAFRIGLGTDIYSNKTEYETYQSNTSGYKISPRLGYEFHQYHGRLRINYGADVRSSFSKGSSEAIYEDPINNRKTQNNATSIGLRPLLGLTVYLNPSISISTETYLDISFGKSTTERLSTGNTTTEQTTGLYVGLGPLGMISVNFHF
jgi:hypothetical protein